jgi:RNA polymerase sigma-70 factor (ECF subfamily)
LVDAYLAARGAEGRPQEMAAEAVAPVERALSSLYARGRDAHPTLNVTDEVFVTHLGRCAADVDAVVAGAHIHAEDLFLCCAALLGDNHAVGKLRDDHRRGLVNHLHSLDSSPTFAEEVEQNLWDAVLIGSAGAPKLASYSGKGPLAGWLGVVTQRTALSLLRHEAAERRARAGAGAVVREASADPELAFVKDSLRESFQRAVTQAMLVLDDRQRLVYSLHVVDGLTADRIAQLYGVVRSTVTRWLASSREAIITEAKRILRDELQVSAQEFESLARLLASQLDLSVSYIFTDRNVSSSSR